MSSFKTTAVACVLLVGLLIPMRAARAAAPVANDDAFSVPEGASLSFLPLANDSDPDGDPLTAVPVSVPAHGTLLVSGDVFIYTPDANFSGTDSFTYQASDGTSLSNVATVTINVINVDNDPPVALGDGPYLGVVGSPVTLDGSASSDPEGAALTFTWNFGDGSAPVTTQQAIINHTYASAGTFTVTLVVNDGQLNSTPFATQASIQAPAISTPGGGQRADVNEFLTYASPGEVSTDLPAGTTSFDVTIIYGQTIVAGTFQASLNGQPFAGFNPAAGTSETVTIPLSSGRNVLKLAVSGVRPDGRTATDRDQLTFIVP